MLYIYFILFLFIYLLHIYIIFTFFIFIYLMVHFPFNIVHPLNAVLYDWKKSVISHSAPHSEVGTRVMLCDEWIPRR
jgi:hypothetical protein